MKNSSVSCIDSSGFHRMHYYEWGDPANPRVVVCVHGLTRQGRDFDFLAQSLEKDFRVVCPDMAGRGRSEWLANKNDYSYAQYMADVTALVARITTAAEQEIDWVGTSMGGLLGILYASRRGNTVRKLVLNDAGTLVPKAALERIGLYVGTDPRFATLDALEAHVRLISAPFGPLNDEQWRHVTLHSAVQHADGNWGFAYDPAIAAPFRGVLSDVDLSAYWDAITCPTLLLRGGDSDLLLRDTALAMTQNGPKAKLVEFAGTGHAPMLMNAREAGVVRDFLMER
jgi:pimeloyl-ACP methyl ester carboxylesterase